MKNHLYPADLAVPDPNASFSWYDPDCFQAHASRWKHRVINDLGALPGDVGLTRRFLLKSLKPQSPVYELTHEYDGKRALVKNFFMLLDSYQNHPEAKSLGPDGQACRPETRGLLQRAHIIANWPPVYIGKESDKHWEVGEDLSLLDFKAIQYTRKGNAVATDEQLERIVNVPKREFIRRGINQHTLEKICAREPVRIIKLARCLKVLEEYEATSLECASQ